ncbi:hypothetical protein CYK04_04110 [Rothia dentocariosa]|nr:hypothetical protein CYK04_04110 [Rothia dentocariosa]
MKKICIMFVHGIGKRDKKVLEEMGRPVLEYLNAPKKIYKSSSSNEDKWYIKNKSDNEYILFQGIEWYSDDNNIRIFDIFKTPKTTVLKIISTIIFAIKIFPIILYSLVGDYRDISMISKSYRHVSSIFRLFTRLAGLVFIISLILYQVNFLSSKKFLDTYNNCTKTIFTSSFSLSCEPIIWDPCWVLFALIVEFIIIILCISIYVQHVYLGVSSEGEKFINKIAENIQDTIKKSEWDEVYVVAHSQGGYLSYRAINLIYKNNPNLLDKIKRFEFWGLGSGLGPITIIRSILQLKSGITGIYLKGWFYCLMILITSYSVSIHIAQIYKFCVSFIYYIDIFLMNLFVYLHQGDLDSFEGKLYDFLNNILSINIHSIEGTFTSIGLVFIATLILYVSNNNFRVDRSGLKLSLPKWLGKNRLWKEFSSPHDIVGRGFMLYPNECIWIPVYSPGGPLVSHTYYYKESSFLYLLSNTILNNTKNIIQKHENLRAQNELMYKYLRKSMNIFLFFASSSIFIHLSLLGNLPILLKVDKDNFPYSTIVFPGSMFVWMAIIIFYIFSRIPLIFVKNRPQNDFMLSHKNMRGLVFASCFYLAIIQFFVFLSGYNTFDIRVEKNKCESFGYTLCPEENFTDYQYIFYAIALFIIYIGFIFKFLRLSNANMDNLRFMSLGNFIIVLGALMGGLIFVVSGGGTIQLGFGIANLFAIYFVNIFTYNGL